VSSSSRTQTECIVAFFTLTMVTRTLHIVSLQVHSTCC